MWCRVSTDTRMVPRQCVVCCWSITSRQRITSQCRLALPVSPIIRYSDCQLLSSRKGWRVDAESIRAISRAQGAVLLSPILVIKALATSSLRLLLTRCRPRSFHSRKLSRVNNRAPFVRFALYSLARFRSAAAGKRGGTRGVSVLVLLASTCHTSLNWNCSYRISL